MTKKLLLTSALIASMSSTALAGGLDRATFSPSILFEEGTYMETSFGKTEPSVKPDANPLFTPTGSEIAPGFSTYQFGIKTDISDKFAIAVKFNSNPYGVLIDYANVGVGGAADLTSLQADLRSVGMSFLGKYKVNERFSVFGGLNYTSFSGNANLSVPVGLRCSTDATFAAANAVLCGNLATGSAATSISSAPAFSPVIGAAYEIPDIALRVAATFELGGTAKPTVSSINPFLGLTGTGEIKTPDVFLLEFQSGIAANTLLFGNIRHQLWSKAQVNMGSAFGNYQPSSFDDSTSYSLGIGRRFNENLAASLSVTFTPGDATGASLLSPRGESTNVALGIEYSMEDAGAISFGVSHTKDKATSWDGPDGTPGTADDLGFNSNSITSFGIKYSKTF